MPGQLNTIHFLECKEKQHKICCAILSKRARARRGSYLDPFLPSELRVLLQEGPVLPAGWAAAAEPVPAPVGTVIIGMSVVTVTTVI